MVCYCDYTELFWHDFISALVKFHIFCWSNPNFSRFSLVSDPEVHGEHVAPHPFDQSVAAGCEQIRRDVKKEHSTETGCGLIYPFEVDKISVAMLI